MPAALTKMGAVFQGHQSCNRLRLVHQQKMLEYGLLGFAKGGTGGATGVRGTDSRFAQTSGSLPGRAGLSWMACWIGIPNSVIALQVNLLVLFCLLGWFGFALLGVYQNGKVLSCPVFLSSH